uniref:Glucan endo-1,3-beta-D-glucosidase n=1 Tax=Physcomitrium patens TaxID=3218 RepID=A0A2K1ITH3_PHYPA|nr:hypothetical protein PHYPA_024516 [Physcomitrium patens]
MATLGGIVFVAALIVVAMEPVLTASATIGIAIGVVGNDLPSRAVTNVRIYNADREMLTAFKNSSIIVTVAVPNYSVGTFASSPEAALNWINTNVKPFASNVSILLSAMQNTHASLVALSLNIKVTTPHASDATGFPPSEGKFPKPDAMKRILQFLKEKNSAFMLNVYPFFAYTLNAAIDRNYAVFNPNNKPVIDMGRTYTNLFDALVDTHRSAMATLGYPDFPLVIGESGWPSAGSNARGVNIQDAQTYNNNLVKHVLSNKGTPMRPNVRMPTYIFALFNENLKGGGIENNWGLYHPNMTPVYSINLSV